MKINETKLQGLDKLGIKFLVDKSESGRLRAFALKENEVRGYISLYLHDSQTYEVSSVFARNGLGKMMYGVAAMELGKDDIWISPSTTGDTNDLAMRVWDSLLDDNSVEKQFFPDLEDNIISYKFMMEPEEWFENKRITDQDIDESQLAEYQCAGQMLFDIMYKRAERGESLDLD